MEVCGLVWFVEFVEKFTMSCNLAGIVMCMLLL